MSRPAGISANRWSDRLIDRLAYAHDASIYRLVPEAIARPQSEEEVKSLFDYANESKTPLTFRTGGTSLSGQSITNGIIAEISKGWQNYEILNNGTTIRLEPGIIGSRANLYLSPYNKRIGPDPASINAARIGGIISNNSSGMVCGVKYNSYHTMKNIRFMLSNGHVYDTRYANDFDRFIENESKLVEGLLACKNKIESNERISNKIKSKYKIKNTLGYSLNAFIDYNHPLDIFSHLIVGAEGTLAFFSSVEMETVDDPPIKSTGLVLFESIKDAVSALPLLVDEGSDAVELLDDASLRTAKYLKDAPYDYSLINDNAAGLLFEFQKHDIETIELLNLTIPKALKSLGGYFPLEMTSNTHNRLQLWEIRKGLYPTVGAMRKKGTSVINEDLCYDYRDLPKVVSELKLICNSWNYNDAVIFGHAKDGNLHFAASMELNSLDGERRFAGLMNDIVTLTAGNYNGSLKAEHGTGRNMAPFVEYEWGGDLYKVMWEVKSLADPNNILNPDVLLTKDDKLHIKNLKKIPIISDEVDLCVECGFCEPICPSKELTLTPRQRIALQREIKLGNADASVLNDYSYDGIETCATDGLCEISCPVNINTGSYIKSLRQDTYSKPKLYFVQILANHFGLVQCISRFGLRVGKIFERYFGKKSMLILTKWMHKVLGTPKWHPQMPNVTPPYKSRNPNIDAKWVYYPSCISRIFSGNENNSSLIELIFNIGERSDQKVIIPDNIQSTCCSQPFASKGYKDAASSIQSRTIDLLWQTSQKGALPIVIDTSPCTYQMLNPNPTLSDDMLTKLGQLEIIDIVEYLAQCVKSIKNPKLLKNIALHPTCSTDKMGLSSKLESLAKSCADDVKMPNSWGCCGFAGDKGLNTPELNQLAVEKELTEVNGIKSGYSSCRTCEMGMMRDGAPKYQSIAYLVYEYLNQTVN